MIEVVVVGEGQTEETFVRDVLAPRLAEQEIFVQPRLIATSRQSRGGALNRDRVLRSLRNTLRERADVYVATFFDLYGLAPDFPGRAEAHALTDPLARASAIEARLVDAVVAEAQCRADRFVPHIQPHEFEALLFSNPDALVDVEPAWLSAAEPLRAAKAAATSPEHINGGVDTHPSARLRALLRPAFDKVLHGPRAAQRIGLECMREECRHFGQWLSRLEALKPL
jgi:hypothetical protein